jgi:D-3-phosphoglycerate dehydrogenase
MSSKVFITDYTIADELDIEEAILAPAGLKIVRAACTTEADVLAAIEGVDPVAIITQWAPTNAAVMDRCPNLKVVSRNGIGVDNIDLEYCRARGIAVTNSPTYCTTEVADHAVALMLALVRKLVLTTDEVRGGAWGAEFLPPLRRLGKLTLGIIGGGRIGTAVAQRAAPFFGEVVVNDCAAEGCLIASEPVHLLPLAEVLRRADVLTLHVPGTDETRHLINAAALAQMKPTAYLVNTCRGSVVDTEALVAALQNGRLAGAGLDVHEQEPLPTDHPLRSCPQVIITPHVAYYSEEAVEDVRADTCVNIVNVLSAKPPVNRVV